MDRSLNPVAGMSPADLLTDQEAQSLLGDAGIDALDGEWHSGPERLDTTEAQLADLNAQHEIVSYGGITGSDADPTVVFVHVGLAETDDDDVVALFAGKHWAVDRSDREYVGDDGYLSPSEFEDRGEHVRSVFEAFVYE